MPRIWRMVALLMMMAIAMAAGLPGPQAMAVSPVSSHPAGCHGHTPAVPFPSPTSFQCCVSGHQAAIPNAAFSLRSSGFSEAQLCAQDAGLRFDTAANRLSVVLVAPSDSPPILASASLRI